jgi:hypothetical protein
MNATKSISRRQGRFREEWSEGSPMAKVRDDEQKPHTRLSPWVSWHNITKPTGSGGRVNAAFVHGKLTFLSGDICASCDGVVMSKIRKRFNRVTKGTGHIRLLSGGYESLWETQNGQRLMTNLVAPFVETCRVSTQKSADGIVDPCFKDEVPNVEMSEASNELVVGVNSDRMSRTPARHGIAFPRPRLGVSVAYIVDRDLIPAKAR